MMLRRKCRRNPPKRQNKGQTKKIDPYSLNPYSLIRRSRHPHSQRRNRAQASAKRPRSRGVERLAAPPRIGGMDSQPRPSGPTKPGGPQEPGAGRTAMCPGEEATRRQPHCPDGRGLFAAIPMMRLDRGQNLRDHRIPACRKARCRVRIDAGRSTRQPDWTRVRPVGDTGKARRDYRAAFRAADGRARLGGNAASPPPSPSHAPSHSVNVPCVKDLRHATCGEAKYRVPPECRRDPPKLPDKDLTKIDHQPCEAVARSFSASIRSSNFRPCVSGIFIEQRKTIKEKTNRTEKTAK